MASVQWKQGDDPPKTTSTIYQIRAKRFMKLSPLSNPGEVGKSQDRVQSKGRRPPFQIGEPPMSTKSSIPFDIMLRLRSPAHDSYGNQPISSPGQRRVSHLNSTMPNTPKGINQVAIELLQSQQMQTNQRNANPFFSARNIRGKHKQVNSVRVDTRQRNNGGIDGTKVKDFAHKFADIVESGDVTARLRPKYNLKYAADGIRFKQFIFDSVEKYQKQKFVKNQHISLKDQQMKSFLAQISNNKIINEDPEVECYEDTLNSKIDDIHQASGTGIGLLPDLGTSQQNSIAPSTAGYGEINKNQSHSLFMQNLAVNFPQQGRMSGCTSYISQANDSRAFHLQPSFIQEETGTLEKSLCQLQDMSQEIGKKFNFPTQKFKRITFGRHKSRGTNAESYGGGDESTRSLKQQLKMHRKMMLQVDGDVDDQTTLQDSNRDLITDHNDSIHMAPYTSQTDRKEAKERLNDIISRCKSRQKDKSNVRHNQQHMMHVMENIGDQQGKLQDALLKFLLLSEYNDEQISKQSIGDIMNDARLDEQIDRETLVTKAKDGFRRRHAAATHH